MSSNSKDWIGTRTCKLLDQVFQVRVNILTLTRVKPESWTLKYVRVKLWIQRGFVRDGHAERARQILSWCGKSQIFCLERCREVTGEHFRGSGQSLPVYLCMRECQEISASHFASVRSLNCLHSNCISITRKNI